MLDCAASNTGIASPWLVESKWLARSEAKRVAMLDTQISLPVKSRCVFGVDF